MVGQTISRYSASARERLSSTLTPRDFRPTWLVVCIVSALCYLVPKLTGALILDPKTVWPLWPGCAILVVGLLVVPLRVWPLLIPAALGGFALYDRQAGVPIASIAWFFPADAVEVLIAALGLRFCFDGVPQLNSVKALAKYSLFAVFLGPLAAAFISAQGIGSEYWSSWRICFFSDVLAFVTVTPAILSWIPNGHVSPGKSRAYYLEAAAQLAALVLLGSIILDSSARNSSPALLYSLVPVLLWSALRIGWRGISTSLVLVAFLSIWGAVHGRGPFAEQGPLGHPEWLQLQLFLVFAATPFMVLAAAIEERKVAQRALVGFGRRLLDAQEQERTRIARELHDDIGQRLALLAVELDQLQQDFPDSLVGLRNRVGELQKQAVGVADDTQSVSHKLHSTKLEHLGVAVAVRSFCKEFGEQQRVEIDFKTHDLPSPLAPDISLCLYRVLQEALHNSAKHSGARRFEVQLWGTFDQIHLLVRDSGSGFEAERAKRSRGLGLISMEERLKLLKGTLSIESRPDRGTTIHACLPFRLRSDSMPAAS